MNQKDKDLLKAVGLTIISIAGSILFFSNINSIFDLSIGAILFATFSLAGLVSIVRLLTMKEKSPEEIATETEEKLVNVSKLDSPCKISIKRSSSFLGAMNYVAVYLHGFEVGRLKNGSTLNFSTEYATNEMILVSEGGGTSIKKTFPAEAGGSIQFLYNYPKGTLE